MPKTTFILVTVLFGVICGNRLMDNRLLRSSSSSSYAAPYKSIGEVNMNSFNGKFNEDLKLKTLEKSSNSINFPCTSDLGFARMTRNCNDNLVSVLKSPTNYLAYDNNDGEVHNSINDFKAYQTSVGDFEDVFGEETFTSPINSKDTKIVRPKLNVFPVANYKDFYDDLVVETAKEEMTKRNGNSIAPPLGSPPPRGCDCKMRNDLVDLGQQHFPRYLLNAVCHSEHSHNDLGPKCWSGSVCRPLEYKVKVLTFRTLMDSMQKDPTLAWLPDDLRQIWKFKTVTVTAGCFCS